MVNGTFHQPSAIPTVVIIANVEDLATTCTVNNRSKQAEATPDYEIQVWNFPDRIQIKIRSPKCCLHIPWQKITRPK